MRCRKPASLPIFTFYHIWNMSHTRNVDSPEGHGLRYGRYGFDFSVHTTHLVPHHGRWRWACATHRQSFRHHESKNRHEAGSNAKAMTGRRHQRASRISPQSVAQPLALTKSRVNNRSGYESKCFAENRSRKNRRRGLPEETLACATATCMRRA